MSIVQYTETEQRLTNTLQMTTEALVQVTAERDALRADAERYLEKLIECRSSVKIAANEFDRFMIRKQPNENQCDIDEQIRLHDLLNWIDFAMKGKS